MELAQPHLPDFSLLGFMRLVKLVMADGNLTRKEAIKALTESLLQAAPASNNPFNFNPLAKVASSLLTRLADYTLKEGLHEAAKMVRWSDETKTLATTQVAEGNVTNMKLDHNLSFLEYMFAKNHFISVIENARWGDEGVDIYNWFFHNLDNHQLCQKGDHGECTLDWHDRAMQKEAYNIGLINEELLASIE
ncbi:hypothetical protein V8B97DRAFT_2023734 [Scleroderma yunnanense]